LNCGYAVRLRGLYAFLALMLLFPSIHVNQQLNQGMETPQAVANVIQLHSTHVIYIENQNNSSLIAGPIYGFEPDVFIAPNSTYITIGNSTYSLQNSAYQVQSNGTLTGFSAFISQTIPEGIFSLTFVEMNFTAMLKYAGVSSHPSSPALYSVECGNSTFLFAGSGFPADRVLGNPVIGNYSYNVTISSNALGAFLVYLPPPPLPGGVHDIRLTDYFQTTGRFDSFPSARLIPSYGHVGQEAVVEISGFYPLQNISITWGEGPVLALNSGRDGSVIAVVTVPPLSAGIHLLYVNSSNLSASAPYNVDNGTLLLSRYSALPGDNITVLAEGFHSEGEVQLLYNNIPDATSNALSNGTAIFHFQVPVETAGHYTLEALSNGNTSNVTVLTVRPVIEGNMEVHVGQTIHVAGNYFYPRSLVTVYISGVRLGDVATNPNGSFSANFTVPLIHGGTVGLYAIDSQGNNASVFDLLILPSVSVSTSMIASGETILLEMNGLLPNHTYIVFLNNIRIAAVHASQSGTVHSYIMFPQVPAGEYILSVGNTDVSFTVTITQPSSALIFFYLLIPPFASLICGSVYLFRKYRIR